VLKHNQIYLLNHYCITKLSPALPNILILKTMQLFAVREPTEMLSVLQTLFHHGSPICVLIPGLSSEWRWVTGMRPPYMRRPTHPCLELKWENPGHQLMFTLFLDSGSVSRLFVTVWDPNQTRATHIKKLTCLRQVTPSIDQLNLPKQNAHYILSGPLCFLIRNPTWSLYTCKKKSFLSLASSLLIKDSILYLWLHKEETQLVNQYYSKD
jgi:hypothetical protein